MIKKGDWVVVKRDRGSNWTSGFVVNIINTRARCKVIDIGPTMALIEVGPQKSRIMARIAKLEPAEKECCML